MDRVHRGLIAALLTCLLAACGGAGGSGRAEVPEGFLTVEGDTFSFAHPPGWVVVEQRDDGLRVSADQELTATTPTAAMTVDDVYRAGPEGLDVAVAGLHATLSTVAEDAEVLAEEEVEVPGAARAIQLERTYTRAGELVHAFDAYLVDEDGTLHYMRASAPADGDVEALRAIMASVELR